MRCFLRYLKYSCTVVVASAVLVAAGAVSEASPRTYVDLLARSVQQVLSRKGVGEVGACEVAQFDMERFSKRCMADHWDDLSNERRLEFIEAFSKSLHGKLEALIQKRAGGREFRYAIGKPRYGNDGVIAVPMKVTVDGDVQLDFVYSLVNVKGEYRLVDYEVEGILLSRNYRGQFNYLIRKYGFEGMLAKMRSKYRVAMKD